MRIELLSVTAETETKFVVGIRAGIENAQENITVECFYAADIGMISIPDPPDILLEGAIKYSSLAEVIRQFLEARQLFAGKYGRND